MTLPNFEVEVDGLDWLDGMVLLDADGHEVGAPPLVIRAREGQTLMQAIREALPPGWNLQWRARSHGGRLVDKDGRETELP